MKLLKKVKVPFGEKTVTLWASEHKGKTVISASAREAILYAWGFGTDQAAELRYEMQKIKTADVSKAEGEK
jgi:hypothetical protein